jgi:UPF0755 protein
MKFILGLFSFSYLFLIGIAISITALVAVFQMPNALDAPREIQIKRGMGTRDIATMLQDEKIIINAYPFMLGSKITNSARPLQAGEFLIPAGMNISGVLDILQNGKTIQRKFTIPEGKTSWEIVQLLNKNEFLDGEVESTPPEGSLMPDTYFFSKGEMRMEKIARMQDAMNNFTNAQDVAKLENLPLNTMEEVMILASIVEKETSVASEYAKVAGVFINRLRKGMLLQTDPTVIYGITKGQHKNDGKGPLGRRLLTKDLKKDTVYNTYTRTGLPPTPICNPGRGAIDGVLNPDTHDYIYFVADGSGGHAFGKTLAQHNANVAKWRKIRRGQ